MINSSENRRQFAQGWCRREPDNYAYTLISGGEPLAGESLDPGWLYCEVDLAKNYSFRKLISIFLERNGMEIGLESLEDLENLLARNISEVSVYTESRGKTYSEKFGLDEIARPERIRKRGFAVSL